MAFSDSVSATRSTLAARRARRVESRRLEKELSAYTSSADMAELDALIARAPEADGADLGRIVTRLRAA